VLTLDSGACGSDTARMNNITSVELSRDCEVVQIPGGNTVTLPRGTAADISQALGGSYTLRAAGGLFRLASSDADAIGLTPETAPTTKPASGGAAEVSEQLIWDTLKTCFDPEIPVNIVDLGLVYDMQLKKLSNGNSRVDVKMTLTAPGCGMGPSIAGDAQQKLLMHDGIEEATVEIVWDPPWHQSMITPDGRKLLGIE
jgi:probable FeS assembly SUF system protein SufT